MSSISGKEYPLFKIFSDDFEFRIPAYQRPYAWTETETGELFDDLYSFFESETTDNYFLGSIVLVKNEKETKASVIDGQQRLTTLTILLAVITDSYQDPVSRSNLKNYIQSQENAFVGIEAKPRLFLRGKEQGFFRKYIQDINLGALDSLDPTTLDTEAKKHIRANCLLLRKLVKETFGNDSDKLTEFSTFILTRCYLVAVYTSSEESAFRIFSVMNSRGLDLLPIDIIKSDTIGKMPESDRDIYTAKWEEMENKAGREGFNEVITHTRTLFVKERPKKNLLEEFKESVLPKTTPKSLIDNYLEPYTEAYLRLKNCAYQSTRNAAEINHYLGWLNKTNNYDWMPPAIKFLTEHPNDPEYFAWFVKKLERLASYLLITARDLNQRFDRYKWLIVEMDEKPDTDMNDKLKSIELEESEKKAFADALNGEIYLMPALRRNYIIQRLDTFVSAGGATYNTKLFTIEHILPQNPNPESEWMQLWQDAEQRRYWLNRIANLVPLTRQKNSAAQNYDFATKKNKYFKGANGTTSYALTTQVLNTDKWTPEVVESRQAALLGVFCDNWELDPDPNAAHNADTNAAHNADANAAHSADTNAAHSADTGAELNQNVSVFMLAGRGGNASGYPVGTNKFVVKKGSRIAPDVTDGMPKGYKELRNKLINDGIIVNCLFTEDYEFDSPSGAATVVLGRSANGPKEWKYLDGTTLGTSSR